MKCPECDGTGQIALFVSVQKCPACNGTGVVSNPEQESCSTDPFKGSPSLQSAYEGGYVTIVGGDLSIGGDITISSGNTTGTEGAGDLYLSTGNGNADWVFPAYDRETSVDQHAALELQSNADAPSCGIFTGNTAPNKKGVDASMGSIFMCDNGAGSLWVKTGPDSNDWTELSTGSGTADADPYRDHRYTWGDNEKFDRPQVVAHVADVLDKYRELERQARAGEIDMDSFHEMKQELPLYDLQVPVVAPISSAVIADMMAMIEQEGLKVIGFVSSCRDYADLRKWNANTIGCEWDGSNFTYFGVPMWQSSELPPGFFAAVDENKKIVLSLITR